MAEAADLRVTISGDASGLISAVNEARAGLSSLEETAAAAVGLDGTSVKFSIRAEDNASDAVNSAKASVAQIGALVAKPIIEAADKTAAGVASAKARIDSVRDKTVTISVNYRTSSDIAGFARGTDSAPEGLAVVNDERGVSDPRELIYHDGRFMLFSGRDVVLPLDEGDRVYTAEQTKKILRSAPHYANGLKNEWFEAEKSDYNHRLASSNVSLSSQLEWWTSAMKRYSYDSEVVKECNDEIFSITRKLAENLNSLSEIYVNERAYFNDFEEYGDTAIEAFDRVKSRNYADLQSGLITWEEYTENLSEIGSGMYNERLSQSERWLEQESKYNNLSNEDYIAGLERMKTYTKEYYSHGIISYKEYFNNMQSLSNRITDKEKSANETVYNKWLSDAENWKKIRDTYDDWEEYGDSPVKYYRRCIERIEELYKSGVIGWRKYMDETMSYSLALYKAQEDEADDLLEAQSEYIKRVKTNASQSESALKTSWEIEDRKEETEEVKRKMEIYKNSVTEEGQSVYLSLQKQLKSLEREEQLYNLQKSNNESIKALEEQYSVMESNKKQLISTIEDTGIDTEKLVRGINEETSGIQSVMTSLAAKIVQAIGSLNTYSDNRSFNISSSDSSLINRLIKSMEATITGGRY